MSCLAGKPLFAYHWDSAFFWLEVPRELFEKFGPATDDLNAKARCPRIGTRCISNGRRTGTFFLKTI